MKDKLLEAAQIIKDYCSNKGVYDEKQCPFFRGYYTENEQCKNIICALNLGHTSPANWNIK